MTQRSGGKPCSCYGEHEAVKSEEYATGANESQDKKDGQSAQEYNAHASKKPVRASKRKLLARRVAHLNGLSRGAALECLTVIVLNDARSRSDASNRAQENLDRAISGASSGLEGRPSSGSR